MIFHPEPALRLVDEAVFVVVNAHRADCAFAKIEYFVAIGRAFAGKHSGLIVAIQMVFVSPVAELHAFEQLIGDIRVSGHGSERGQPVHAGHDAVLYGTWRDMARPPGNTWHAETALHNRPLRLRERRGAAIRPGERFGSVVGGENDDGVIV